eukprot:COSAG04_NODE_1046_length_8572_cov_5.008970_4_plen_309_part_00
MGVRKMRPRMPDRSTGPQAHLSALISQGSPTISVLLSGSFAPVWSRALRSAQPASQRSPLRKASCPSTNSVATSSVRAQPPPAALTYVWYVASVTAPAVRSSFTVSFPPFPSFFAPVLPATSGSRSGSASASGSASGSGVPAARKDAARGCEELCSAAGGPASSSRPPSSSSTCAAAWRTCIACVASTTCPAQSRLSWLGMGKQRPESREGSCGSPCGAAAGRRYTARTHAGRGACRAPRSDRPAAPAPAPPRSARRTSRGRGRGASAARRRGSHRPPQPPVHTATPQIISDEIARALQRRRGRRDHS